MTKKDKTTVLLTSIVILLPMAVGAALWRQLPKTMATHFRFDGTANGWSSKPVAVFGIPLLILAVHLLCALVTAKDPKRQNISGKIYQMVLWICPAVSLLCGAGIFSAALGVQLDLWLWSALLEGFLFLVVGNYLPKCRQNYTVGIKLPWTLADEENWNKTHRVAGWSWVIGGIVSLLNAFLRIPWLFVGILLFAVGVPVVYSFLFHCKKQRDSKTGRLG